MTPATLREAAALIESLESERDALAETARVMREALEYYANQSNWTDGDVPCHIYAIDDSGYIARTVLANLTPTAAETQAKANAEKAALVESLESERDALAETARVMREEMQWQYEALNEGFMLECDGPYQLWRCCVCGEHGGDKSLIEHTEECVQGRMLKALALTPTAAEQRARENAEKAGLLDWLDHTRPSLSFGCSPEYPLGAWGIYWTNAQTEQVEDAEAERLPDALRAAREASDD